MTDFIFSGRDRHLSNISVLRDANSLKFVRTAPIYDSGKAMFVNDIVPDNDRDMLKISTESFEATEIKLMSLVKDRSLVDASRLPEPAFAEHLYSLDPNMTESRIKAVLSGYKRKIELFRRWQRGEDIHAVTFGYRTVRPKADLEDLFV